MPKKTFTPEQIVGKLRQIEVAVSQGKTVPLACKEAGIVEQTFYRCAFPKCIAPAARKNSSGGGFR